MVESQLNNLRRMIAMGATPTDIKETLQLTHSNYVFYMGKLAKQDKMLLENDKNSFNLMNIELTALKDRLYSTIRRCTKIAGDEKVPPGTRLEAEKIICEASLACMKLSIEGPNILRQVPRNIKELATGMKNMPLPEVKVVDDGALPQEQQAIEIRDGDENIREYSVEDREEDSGQGAEGSAD